MLGEPVTVKGFDRYRLDLHRFLLSTCHTGRCTRYEVCGQLILRSDLVLLQTMFDLKHVIPVNRRERAILRSDLALLQTMFGVTLVYFWPKSIVHIPHTSYRIPYDTHIKSERSVPEVGT